MTQKAYNEALSELPVYTDQPCDACDSEKAATFCNGETKCANCVCGDVFEKEKTTR